MTVTYFTQSGQQIALGAKLAEGGEAAIFEALSRPSAVAKIYHIQNRTGRRKEKINAMLAMSNPDADASGVGIRLAWPTDHLFSAIDGDFVGFLMTKIDRSKTQSLFSIYHPRTRPRHLTWNDLVVVATNLAAVVAMVHKSRHVIGDFNDDNVLIWPESGLVTLVDCDSFQISDVAANDVFRCEVGVAEYSPLEVLTRPDYQSVNRTPATDNFALAILVFKLLCDGVHPFSGDPGPTIEDNLRNGSHLLDKWPQSGRSSARTLPGELYRLFELCFGPGHRRPDLRPSALVWQLVLVQVLHQVKHDEMSFHKPLIPGVQPGSYRPIPPVAPRHVGLTSPAPSAGGRAQKQISVPRIVLQVFSHGLLASGLAAACRFVALNRSPTFIPEKVIGRALDFSFPMFDQVVALCVFFIGMLFLRGIWRGIARW